MASTRRRSISSTAGGGGEGPEPEPEPSATLLEKSSHSPQTSADDDRESFGKYIPLLNRPQATCEQYLIHQEASIAAPPCHSASPKECHILAPLSLGEGECPPREVRWC